METGACFQRAMPSGINRDKIPAHGGQLDRHWRRYVNLMRTAMVTFGAPADRPDDRHRTFAPPDACCRLNTIQVGARYFRLN